MFPHETQKAIELIRKFYEITASSNRSYSWDIAKYKGGKSFETARQCALICWEERLRAKYENNEYLTVEDRRNHDRIKEAIETYSPGVSLL